MRPGWPSSMGGEGVVKGAQSRNAMGWFLLYLTLFTIPFLIGTWGAPHLLFIDAPLFVFLYILAYLVRPFFAIRIKERRDILLGLCAAAALVSSAFLDVLVWFFIGPLLIGWAASRVLHDRPWPRPRIWPIAFFAGLLVAVWAVCGPSWWHREGGRAGECMDLEKRLWMAYWAAPFIGLLLFELPGDAGAPARWRPSLVTLAVLTAALGLEFFGLPYSQSMADRWVGGAVESSQPRRSTRKPVWLDFWLRWIGK